MKINFQITDLTCDACISLSQAALKNLPGVQQVNIEPNGLTVVEADRPIDFEDIKNELARVGKTAEQI
ncbi:TPA: hypothetical protein DF272_01810 [Candidatus Falkowbacteria bacterium]|nr:hypothetical protein [Candidatus Falkowbacteria bacterium]